MIFDHEFDPCPALWSHNFAGFANIFQRTEAFGILSQIFKAKVSSVPRSSSPTLLSWIFCCTLTFCAISVWDP